MIDTRFSEEMITTIRNMKEKVFCSFECGDITQNEVYGNLQVNLNDFSVEILNEIHEVPFYDSTEEISFFTCKKVQNEDFIPYCAESVQKHVINEKILSVSIVNDFVSVNNGEYEIIFDMAIIIKTNKHRYVFSRGWFFSETITISVDKDLDDVYPIKKVIEDWTDEEKNEVVVKRTVRNL